MEYSLINKQIVVGVTGGIAAYKSADLVRRLREAGATVRVVMTAAAKAFITPLTMQAVSGNTVHDDLFDLQAEAAMGHIELARWADAILIAPATADFMARLAHGEANDLLTTLCVASTAPIAIAPAMNQAMWKNTLTQSNLQALAKQNILIFGPASGEQACGDIGYGRMLEPLELVQSLSKLFSTGVLAGCHVVITAGPTQEAIDPVRYISNASSGKMGYALCQAALEAGATVTLISGPVNLTPPTKAKFIAVKSADEMSAAVLKEISAAEIFIAVAAVADYKCKTIATKKIKKTAATLTLELERNPDIVSQVTQLTDKPFVVAFAAETENEIKNAREKMQNKNVAMIIANNANESIGSDDNSVTVLWQDQQQVFARMPKTRLARELIQLIGKQYHEDETCNLKESLVSTA